MTAARRIILVGAPRSGAGLVSRLLELSDEVVSGPLVSGHVIDEVPGMSAAERGFTSHRLTAVDATPEVRAALESAYADHASVIAADAAGVDGAGEVNPGPTVTVDWNPRLGLRLGLLAAAMPDARFIIVLRRPMPTISSLSQAWRTRTFATVGDLPGWWGEPWSFGLTPQWQEAIGVPSHEVATRQWAGYVAAILDDLEQIDPSRWMVTSYERLLADPDAEVDRITDFCGIAHIELPEELPLSRATLTAPNPDKWQRESSEITVALPLVDPVVRRYRSFRDEHAPEPVEVPETEETADSTPAAPPARTAQASEGTPFASKHTSTFPDLLGQAGASVIVTTYKSGHVILLRRDEFGKLNTEFSGYNRPMGVAAVGSRLSIGTGTSVINMSNTPSLSAKLNPPNAHDAVYMTRSVITTGDVAIHEMVFAGDELWFVNTRFSCICTLDVNHSFVPRWRPPWISALAAEDRCHVNGLTLRDGVPRYATALSQTDTAHGWRELKGTAGLIIDITSNQLITTGLAMPHSPRWYADQLWVLESGKGSLATVDIATGEVTTVAVLPGFTRGLAFLGRYALIGLSQVRESVFKDLPVTQTSTERNCGVWIVDTTTGRIEGFVKFDGVVQEIFDVQILTGSCWPTILREPSELTQNSFVLPPDALRQVAAN